MKLKLYQVDAFASDVFTGNPAVICPLDEWLPDNTMLKIAAENNLSETAFYVPNEGGYEIRWFTPTAEVDLCGHATLATSFVLLNLEGHQGGTIEFHSPRSGKLTVTKSGEVFTLNFPTDAFEPVEMTDELTKSFDRQPLAIYKGKTDFLFEFPHQSDVQTIQHRHLEGARNYGHRPGRTGRFRLPLFCPGGWGQRRPGMRIGPHDFNPVLVQEAE